MLLVCFINVFVVFVLALHAISFSMKNNQEEEEHVFDNILFRKKTRWEEGAPLHFSISNKVAYYKYNICESRMEGSPCRPGESSTLAYVTLMISLNLYHEFCFHNCFHEFTIRHSKNFMVDRRKKKNRRGENSKTNTNRALYT